MKVGSAFLQTLAVQITQSVVSIGTGILIARGLGPDGQGRYAVFAAATGLGVIFGSLGQFENNVLYLEGRATAGRQLLGRSAVHALAVGLILVLTLPLWRAAVGARAGSAIVFFFPIVLALEVEAQLLRGINLGQHQITAYNLSSLIQRVAYLSVVLSLFVSGRVVLGNVLAAWATATFLSAAATAAWIWRRSGPAQNKIAGLFDEWSTAVVRGMRALVTIAASLMLVRCDIWMLGPLAGVRSVGEMSVAITLAEWLWYVPYILGNILFAAVAADRAGQAVGQVCRASRGVVALVAPVALGMVLLGTRVVPLIYGEAYRPAGVLLAILSPGMAAIAVHIVVDSYFAGRGFPAISVWSAIGALLAKAGLNLLVIPVHGAAGAAVATVFVYGALLGVKVYAFTRATGVPVAAVLVPTPEDLKANVRAMRAWIRTRVGLGG